MTAEQASLSRVAGQKFREGSTSADDPFSAPLSTPANEDQEIPGLANQRVEDLVVVLGNGSEESIAYHLYTGTSLREKGSLLVVRFATRHILIEGERLKGLRDAISFRRCSHLRISDRVDRMNAQQAGQPVVTSLRVVTPSKDQEELLSELAEQEPPRPLA